MRTKITSGLVATSADGSPSVRPPIPASWNRTPTPSEGGNESSLDGKDSKPGTAASSPTSQPKMSDVTNITGDTTVAESQAQYEYGSSGNAMDLNSLSNSSNATSEKIALSVVAGDKNVFDNNNAPSGDHPSPPSSSDPNNPTVINSNNNPSHLQRDSEEPVDNISNSAPTATTNVPASSLPSEVLTHMSAEDPCDMDKEIDVECSQDISDTDFHAASAATAPGSIEDGGNETLVKSSGSASANLSMEVPSSNSGTTASSEVSRPKTKLLKDLDPVSMTIESVAAGEGEPPAFLFMERKYNPPASHSSNMLSASSSGNYKKSKMEKGGGGGNASASARLPVISSLLAPAGVNSSDAEMQQLHNSLPGIQHMTQGNNRGSSSPSMVLPSVAHFLGPAKSPPSAFTPHQNSPEMYGGGMYPSSAPRVGSEAGKADMSHLGGSQYQDMSSTPGKNNKASRSGSGSKSVTPAGLRLSMAASEELPDPLPLPQYSDKVLRAKQMGTIAFDRPTVLRETVQFYLQFKHYWSSHDYDRISNLVVELFPEFKDTETPGVPVNKRIRTDLSMYARNFRRREVSQRKKEGTPSSSEAEREPKSEGGSTPMVGAKTFQHSPSPTSGSLASSNPSDFCNELLTAASIIESQNSSSAMTKAEDIRNQGQNSGTSSQVHYQRSSSGAKGSNQHHHHNSQGSGTHMQKQDGRNSGGGKVVAEQPQQPQHHPQQQQHPQHATAGGEEDGGEATPIHFMYDKEAMSAALTRDATTAWQIYTDQVAQAMVGGTNPGQEYEMAEEVSEGGGGGANSDRLSAMAMWRSTALPDPLPTPPYSDAVIRARESGNTMSARPKIIRETTQFFLSLKLWWTAPDYERIAELVLQNFPALVSLQAIKKDLGTCARNMRRRLPSARHHKTPSSPSKSTPESSSSSSASAAVPHQSSGVTANPSAAAPAAAGAQGSSSDYMKALMTAQNMNELGMTQRNLGELAVLAGIKQRMEQRPQDVSDLERQYLAQCTSEEQRQALIASGAFGNDSTAMAALSAFYGQLGMEITPTAAPGVNKRNNPAVGGEYAVDGSSSEVIGGVEGQNQSKRQRRISQAEVERRLKEAELTQSTNAMDSRLHHIHQQQQQQQQQQQHHHHQHHSNHGVTVGVSDKSHVKREPLSPSGVIDKRSSSSSSSSSNYKDQHHHQHHQQQQHHQLQQQQQQQQQHINSGGGGGGGGSVMYPPPASHDQVYWEAQAIANMALLNHPSTTSSPFTPASQAHSHNPQQQQQQQQQHLPPPHDIASATAAVNAGFSVSDTPMNLTYDGDKHSAASMPRADPSPLAQDTLPDTASLAAQVEVTTSATTKSGNPRRRTSSSPRAGDASREQVWFPHGAGFKKENQEVVSLPEPLPIPDYSSKIASAREDGSVVRHRSEIIRETARFFLGLKYWWSSADYTRISELVVEQFPELRDENTSEGMNGFRRIQRDLSMCARNLRRSKKPRRERGGDGSAGLHSQDPNLGGGIPSSNPHPVKRSKASRLAGERKARRVGAGRKRNKGLGGVSSAAAAAAAAASNAANGSGSGGANHHESVTAMPEPAAVVPMPSVTEETEAAAALLQQQFMQQSSSYQHPSAHLLPSSHLLPSLQTHPALHDQQMQLSTGIMQAQPPHGHIGIDESGKGLVKDEPCGNSMEDGMDQDNTGAGMKAAPMTSALGKPASPLLDTVHSEAQEVARALARAPSRDMEGTPVDKLEQDKVGVAQPVLQNTMKVYQDPDHGNDLQERFAGLWRKGKFFDASLGVASKKLHVHKLVLLAMSPYLQETFKNADPRSQLEVNLPSDTTYETAKAFLKYIYEGVLEVDTSSVRSLHKIATMLQMSKLAQYCQNFAQQLHEAAESTNAAVQGDLPKISVTLGDFAQLEAVQRQKILEAQALQRLGDTTTINSSDMHGHHQHRMHGSSRYHISSEEQNVLKAEYMSGSNPSANDPTALATQNFLQQEALAQHRALIAATASVQSSSSTPSALPPSSSLLLTSSTSTTTASSSQQYHHHNSQLHQQQQEQQQLAAMQNDNNAALLHRLASEASSSTNSLDQQQRLALAAYWQAHAQSLELMSRSNQLDPATLTSAELAAAASAEEQRQLLSSLGHHEVKLKGGGRADHHSSTGKEWVGGDAGDGHQAATMLPETCIPVDMARSHQVANAEGT